MPHARFSIRRQVAKLAAIMFAVVSVLCFCTVVMQIIHGKKLRQDGLKADGVVYYIRNGNAVPYVRFALPDGREVEFSEYILNNGFRIGQHVPVLYQATDPAETARVETNANLDVDMIYVVGCFIALAAASVAGVQASSDEKIG